ncbi:MAG: UDP-N-acetylglucosamine 2-epimerase (hydrolyzing) [Candidatus Omnitrophica bacterium]|nr:UDP-N-acetylglucosamine 2-epimerase (hydrolyzing) [Candidatus Omnitrophota bacterium]
MKKIAVVTGTRAEYGILKPLIEKIAKDKAFKLYIFVTGAHLSKYHGMTVREIENDGFIINERVDIGLEGDTEKDIAAAFAKGVRGFSAIFDRFRPDVLLLLGDRYEILAAASAAMFHRIPIAHIAGGETTVGAIDEAIRHSITKMSHYHFTLTERARQRVIQLGEAPERVFRVGAFHLDGIKTKDLLGKKELENKYGVKFGAKNLLVTYHPVTLEERTQERQMRELIKALDRFKDITVIFTKTNADTGGRSINRLIDGYVKANRKRAFAVTSMGRIGYLSAMRNVDGVVGNSSSGIIEAPSFKVGTVNIGNRQKGREKGSSVIDCEARSEPILRSLELLLSGKFRENLANTVNPYYSKDGLLIVLRVLKRAPLKDIIKKVFNDRKKGKDKRNG